MATLGTLSLKVTAINDTAAGLAAARAQLAGFGNAMRSTLGAVGIGLSVAGISAMVKSTVELADGAGDMAKQLGVSSAALTRLQFAAELGGSSTEALNTALGKLNKTLGDARSGGGASASFRELGLNVQELIAMSPDQAFAEIAEQISKIESPSQRARLAMNLFGKSGQDVINVLSLGKRGLREFGEESDRVGFTLTENADKAFDSADKAMKRFDASLTGLKRNAIVNLEGLWQPLANAANQQVQALASATKSWVGFGQTIARAIDPLKAVFQAFRQNKTAVDGVAEAANKAAAAVQKLSSVKPPVWLDRAPLPFEKEMGGILADLKRQQETFGMTANEIKLYDLSLMDVNQVDLEFAQNLVKSIDAMEKQKALFEEVHTFSPMGERNAFDDLIDAAERLEQETRTPMERFEQRMSEINDMLAVGAISQETFNRAAAQAQADFSGGGEVKLPAAIERRFTFSTPSDRAANDPAEIARRQLREQEKTRAKTEASASSLSSIDKKLSGSASVAVFNIN